MKEQNGVPEVFCFPTVCFPFHLKVVMTKSFFYYSAIFYIKDMCTEKTTKTAVGFLICSWNCCEK